MVHARFRRCGLLTCAGVLAFFCLAGCATTKKETPWVPPPPVSWDDLATQPFEPPRDAYELIEDEPSQGRFPCALAVSRMAVDETSEEQGMRKLCIPATPQNEFLIWNSAFDDQPPLSEAFPVVQRDLAGYPADAKLVVQAGRHLHAGMSLIYAANALGPKEYEILGVLYDTRTGKAIAALHAQAETLPRPEDDETPNNVDAWQYEARARARSKFKQLARECLRRLIARDVPLKEQVPEGWKGDPRWETLGSEPLTRPGP